MVSKRFADGLSPENRLPDSARRAVALGLGLLPMMPMLSACGGGGGGGGSGAAQSSAPSTPGGTSAGSPATPVAPAPVPASVSGVFKHPGLLVTEDSFTRIRAAIKAGQDPWTSWWNKMCADPVTSLTSKPNPQAAVYRQDSSKYAMYNDINRAWCLALRWRLSDDTRYADKAVETLDAWSSTLKEIGTVPPGSTAHDDHTFIILAGIQGHQWAQSGEIMRGYAGWAPENLKRFQDMLTTIFASVSSWFLSDGRIGSHANWDMASMAGAMAMGVFCDNAELYRLACDCYAANNRGKLRTFGNGSALHGVYYMHPGHFGQWEESGRDQGHSTLGISLGSDLMEMAWNQGDDLYGLYNNRFLAAAEYVARSNLLDATGKTYPMPYIPEQDPTAPHTSRWTEVNQAFGGGPGSNRNAWEPIYNHYVNRLGLAAPNVGRMMAVCEPNQGSHTGDDVVYPTLVFRRPDYSGPLKPPSGLTGYLNGGNVLLSWWGSVGATAYVVSRSASARGPFTNLATITSDQVLTYTDTPGNGIWYYRVVAQNGMGASTAGSNVVRVAASGEHRLTMPLNSADAAGLSGTLLAADGTTSTIHGTLLDNATWGDGRKNDKAVAFDGKASGLQLPQGIFSNLDDFSLSVWVYANGLHWDSCILFAGTDAFSALFIAPQSGAKGVLRFGIYGATGNDAHTVEAPTALPTKRWVHVTVTLKGTTGRLYVDGAEVANSDDILLTPRQVGDQVTFLGRNWAHPPFNGRIQDFRVYAGALSAAEVAALAQ